MAQQQLTPTSQNNRHQQANSQTQTLSQSTTPPTSQPQIHSPLLPQNQHIPSQSRALSLNIPTNDQHHPNSFSPISKPDRERSPPHMSAQSRLLDHIHQRDREAMRDREPLRISHNDLQSQYYNQLSQLGRQSPTDSYDEELSPPPPHQLSSVPPLLRAPPPSLPSHLMPPNSSSNLLGSHLSMSSTPRLREPPPDENTDLEELEHFAKTFKQRRIKLGKFSGPCMTNG